MPAVQSPHIPRAPRLLIDVLQQHIEMGVRNSDEFCMISEAIKSKVPEATHVSTDLQTIRFSDPRRGYRYIYLTPREPQIALLQFDQGIKPKPFRFHLAGGQTTAVRVTRLPNAKLTHKKQELAHKLGTKKTIISEDRKTVDIIGGKQPGKPRPKGAALGHREFGLRAITAKDLCPDKLGG